VRGEAEGGGGRGEEGKGNCEPESSELKKGNLFELVWPS